MRKVLFVGFLIVALCGCSTPPEVPPVVIKDIDFDYDIVWKAVCASIELQGFQLEWCNKDDRRIITYHKILPETDVRGSWLYSKKAFITLIPRPAPTIVKYDITIHVGLYWKSRTPITDPEERWEFIRWDREVEDAIVAEFHNQIAVDQRIRQGHEELKKKGATGF